jgi:hypothetical protein
MISGHRINIHSMRQITAWLDYLSFLAAHNKPNHEDGGKTERFWIIRTLIVSEFPLRGNPG